MDWFLWLHGWCDGGNEKNLPGGDSAVVPPDPMPNSEVKRRSADGSVGSPHARVGNCQASYKEPPVNAGGFLLWGREAGVTGWRSGQAAARWGGFTVRAGPVLCSPPRSVARLRCGPVAFSLQGLLFISLSPRFFSTLHKQNNHLASVSGSAGSPSQPVTDKYGDLRRLVEIQTGQGKG